MYLDIKIEKKREMRCNEAILSTVAVWLGRRYEMIFSEFWNFDLLEEIEQDSNFIGKRVVIESGDVVKLFEKYHGIKVTSYNIVDKDWALKTICSELEKGFPICTSIKGEFVPWMFSKEKQDYFPFLIIGFNEAESLLHCVDVHYLNKVSNIPLESFLQGFYGINTFSIVHDEVASIQWREILKDNIEALIKNDAFRKIREVSRLILETDGYNICNRNNAEDGDYELVEKIQDLHRSRFLFSYTIEYYIKNYGAHILNGFPEEFISLANEWLYVWGLLNKYIFKKNFPEKRDYISKKIAEISLAEEKLCKALSNILDSSEGFYNIENTSSMNDNVKIMDLISQIKSYFFVEISGYYNNKGFSTNLRSECIADFTGTGEFFHTEGLPNEEVIEKDNVKFYLPNPNDINYDNISCSGEKISFEKDNYSCIILIGCAEWGDQSTHITVNYSDHIVKIPFSISDWSLSNPVYNELVMWKGNCYNRSDRGIEPIEWFKGHIFAKIIGIDNKLELETITLPDCNNLHIFAISLGK